MKIVTVLRQSKEYQPLQVQVLHRQAQKYAPWADFLCLSDVPVPDVPTAPLKTKWPGWWSKMELFDPELKGDFLFVDLDTVFVGDLEDVLTVGKLTVIGDFYREHLGATSAVQSGLMWLPWEDRAEVWEYFMRDPEWNMKSCLRRDGTDAGDQMLLEHLWLKKAARWQVELPGQVISYKRHCCRSILGQGLVYKGVPETARVICFHGRPRPWTCPHFEGLYK